MIPCPTSPGSSTTRVRRGPLALPCRVLRTKHHDMEQRNLLIAIVLSVGILIAFQFAFERLRPPQPPPPSGGTSVTAPATPGQSAPAAPATSATTGPGSNAPGTASGQAVAPREAVIAEQPRVKINTPSLH